MLEVGVAAITVGAGEATAVAVGCDEQAARESRKKQQAMKAVRSIKFPFHNPFFVPTMSLPRHAVCRLITGY
jgi:hypothetical protein